MAFYSQIRFMLIFTFGVIIAGFLVNTVYPMQLDRTQIVPRENAVSIDTEIYEQLQEFQKITLSLLYQSYAGYFITSMQSEAFERTTFIEDWLVSFAKFMDVANKRNEIQDDFSVQFNTAIRDLKYSFSTEVGNILNYLYAVESDIQQLQDNDLALSDLTKLMGDYLNANSTLISEWGNSEYVYAQNIRSTDNAEADRAVNATISILNLWDSFQRLITQTLSELNSLRGTQYEELNVTSIVNGFETKQSTLINTYSLYRDQLLNDTETGTLDPIFFGMKNSSLLLFDDIKNYLVSNMKLNNEIIKITTSDKGGIPGSLGRIAERLESLSQQLKRDVSLKRAEVLELNKVVSQRAITMSLITVIIVFLMIAFSFVRIIPPLTLLRSKATLLAKGDLTLELFNPKGKDELSEVQRAFDMMVVSMKKVIHQGQMVAEKVAGISEELAAAAEEASSSVQEVSATVSEISYGASEQTEMVNKVSEQLKMLLDHVNDTVERINEAAEFVKKVSKRTNILGLNASIEAAKAGIYGQGFGIVAQSVRELAEDTKDRADEIAELIQTINITLKRTMEDVADAVDKVRQVAEQTAAGSEEANAASEEQTAMMEEISSTSAELANLSQELLNVLSQFKT